MHVNDLLKIAVEKGASDLHLKAGSYPMMRIRGGLMPVSQDRRLDHEDMIAITSAGVRRPLTQAAASAYPPPAT